MKKKKKRPKILETKYFGFLIGIFIILLFLLASHTTNILTNLETRMLDIHFNYKNVFLKESLQEGVSYEQHNPNISSDILIVGIDFKSLDKFGKWPFPRWRHADLLKSFARIQNQNERERAIFLDTFFIEPDKDATHDAILIDALKENGRTFLETVLDEVPPPSASSDEYFARQQRLYEGYGEIKNIIGEWEKSTGILRPAASAAALRTGYIRLRTRQFQRRHRRHLQETGPGRQVHGSHRYPSTGRFDPRHPP